MSKFLPSKSIYLFSVLFASNWAIAQPQSTQIVIGERYSIFSEVLGEDREIKVGTPPGYDNSGESYPVLYMIDGAEKFHSTTGLTRFLAYNEIIPGLIVVAIPMTDRARDLYPSSSNPSDISDFSTQGGADSFLAFIQSELKPWVEKKYRIQPYSILMGHSRAGLFAINTLITEPNAFDAYIAISPSLQWNDQYLIQQAEDFFENSARLQKDLFITAGSEGTALLGGVHKLSGVLAQHSPPSFRWAFQHFPMEHHSSVPLRSTLEGLEFVFSDWYAKDFYRIYKTMGIEALDSLYAYTGSRIGIDRELLPRIVRRVYTALVRDSEFAEAQEVLELYESRYDADASMYNILGNRLEAEDRSNEAISAYQSALRIEPNNETALKALGRL